MPVTVCEFESRPGHSKNGLQVIVGHFSFSLRPHYGHNFESYKFFHENCGIGLLFAVCVG